VSHVVRSSLVALSGAAKAEVKPGDLPARINVAPWGTHTTSKGRVIVNETTARELPANQKRTNLDRVALDFNHNTVPDSETYRGEPAKIAAMGTPSVVPGEGIILDDLDWTPEGRDYVGNKHYVDLSPTIQMSPQDEVVLLHSAAVCRAGAVPGLTLFSANPLVESAIISDDQARELLCMLLGLAATSKKEDVIQALRSSSQPTGDLSPSLQERLIDLLSGKGEISEPKMRILNAFLPDKRAAIIEAAVLRNMGVSPERAAKFSQ
jgi:phage I-like protein